MLNRAGFLRGLTYFSHIQSIVRTPRLSIKYNSILSNHNHAILEPSNSRNSQILQARHLYTNEVLGLEKLDRLRKSKSNFYGNAAERYIKRLNEYIESGEIKAIFSEDLLNVIGLAENEEHYDLVDKLAALMKDENHINLGYTGVTIMRLYLDRNQTDRALRNIKDVDRFGPVFSLLTSYQIVMTLLFRDGRYNDLLDVFKISCERLKFIDDKPARRLAVLTFAAYAKQSTEESLAAAESLFALDPNNMLLRKKVISFLAYICYNLGKYTEALNWLSLVAQNRYVTNREIKTLSLINLNRFEDLDFHLRDTLNNSTPNFSLLTRDSFDKVRACLEKISDDSLRESISDILVQAEKNNLINDQSSIEDLIFNPIKPKMNLHLTDELNQTQQWQQQPQMQRQLQHRTQERQVGRLQGSRSNRNFSNRPRRVFAAEDQMSY